MLMPVRNPLALPAITCLWYRLTRTGKGRELDGSGETLVTLGVVVLEADLELDGLEEVPLLGLVGVLKELLNVRTNAGDRDFRHVG